MGSGCSPGGQPTRGKPIGLRGAAPALSGLVGQPKRPYAQEKKKSKEKEKKERGKWEGREGLHLPILVGLGLEEESSSPLRPTPLGLLEPQGMAPPLRPIYLRF